MATTQVALLIISSTVEKTGVEVPRNYEAIAKECKDIWRFGDLLEKVTYTRCRLGLRTSKEELAFSYHSDTKENDKGGMELVQPIYLSLLCLFPLSIGFQIPML